MLPVIAFLTLCFVSTLAAETIGNVEYKLPEEGSGWKVEKMGPKEGIPGTTILYQPENQSPLGIEFFGAYIKNSPTDLKSSETLKEEIKTAYPDHQVTFNVLSSDPESELVEWKVVKDNVQLLHGWARIFSGGKTTTMLFYQNEKGAAFENLDNIEKTWIKTLKDAKSLPADKDAKSPSTKS